MTIQTPLTPLRRRWRSTVRWPYAWMIGRTAGGAIRYAVALVAISLATIPYAHSQENLATAAGGEPKSAPTVPDLSPGPLGIAPADLNAWAQSQTDDDDSPGYVGLLSHSDVRLRADGTRQVRHWTINQVTTREAVRESIRTETSWSPFHSSQPTLKVRIIQPDGSVLNLDGEQGIVQDSGDTPDAGTIDDTKRLILLLAGLRIGSVIESVESYEFKPSISGFSFSRHPMSGFGTLALSQLNVSTEPGATFRWDAAGWDIQPVESTGGPNEAGWTEARFEVRNPTPIMDELQSLCGPDTSSFPMIRISQGGTWNDVASAYDKLFRPKVQRATPIAKQLIAGIDPDLPTTELINQCVDRLRATVVYTGVEFGINRIVPYDAEEIIARGFGDCKDQSMMMVAMLAEFGIQADVALISTGHAIDASPSMPTIAVFDHVIVRVRAGGQEHWIDPTATQHPVDILPLACSGRRALIVRSDTNDLVVTPRRRAVDDVFSSSSTVQIDGGGYGTQIESTTYNRFAAVRIRSGISLPIESTGFRDEIAKLFQAESDRVGVNYDPQHPDQFNVTVRYAPLQHADVDEQFLGIPFDLRMVMAEIPDLLFPPTDDEELSDKPNSERRFNVVLPHAFAERRSYRVELPMYYQLKTDVAPLTASMGPLQIQLKFEQDKIDADAPDRRNRQGVTVSAIVVLDQKDQSISPQQLEAIQSFVGEWIADDSELVGRLVFEDPAKLNHSEPSFSFSQLQASLQRCQQYPDDIYERAQLAVTLRKSGLPIAARAIARQSFDADQSHAYVRLLVQDLLLNGDNQLPYGPGWDIQASKQISDLELEHEQTVVQGMNFIWALLVNDQSLRNDDEQVIRQAAKFLIEGLSRLQMSPEQNLLIRERAVMLLIQLGEDRLAANLIRQNTTSLRVEGLATRWFADRPRGDALWNWARQHLEDFGHADIQDASIAVVIDRVILELCAIGRFDLGTEILNSLPESKQSRTLRFRDPAYFQPQPEPESRAIDFTDPEQVARNGVANFLLAQTDPTTNYLDPDRLPRIPRMVTVDEALETQVLEIPLQDWTPAALRHAVWRLPFLYQQITMGGRAYIFDVPSIARRDAVVVVPWDDGGEYRWFFSDDRITMVKWARRALSRGDTKGVIDVLNKISSLDGEIADNPFRGPAATRIWNHFKDQDDRPLALIVALFAVDTRQATDDDEALISRAIQDNPAKNIQTQLLRSMTIHLESQQRYGELFDLHRQLFEINKDELAVVLMMLNASQANGELDRAKTYLLKDAERRRAADRQLIQALVDAYTGNAERAIETLVDSFDELDLLARDLGDAIIDGAPSQNVPAAMLTKVVDLQMRALGDDVSVPSAVRLVRVNCELQRTEMALKYLRLIDPSDPMHLPARINAEAVICQSLQLRGLAKQLHQRVVNEHPQTKAAIDSQRQLERLKSPK